jgi:integrase
MSQVTTRVERGLYERGGRRSSSKHRFVAGYHHPQSKRWTMTTLKARTLREARRERGALLAAIDEGRKVTNAPDTFQDVFAAWQELRAPGERQRSHERNLLDWYLSKLAARKVQGITTADLTRVMRDMEAKRLSDWTRIAALRVVTGVCTHALEEGLIAASPVARLPKGVRPSQRNANARAVRCLTLPETERLVAAGASQRWQTALALAAWGGLRLGEMRGLKWADVRLEDGDLCVRRSLLPNGTEKAAKTKAGKRILPLLDALSSELVAWASISPWPRPSDYVLCDAQGGPVKQSALRSALRSALKRAEITFDPADERLSWHSLRHSAGSLWLHELGAQITDVSTWLGHENLSFTYDTYIGKSPEHEATARANFRARAEAMTLAA